MTDIFNAENISLSFTNYSSYLPFSKLIMFIDSIMRSNEESDLHLFSMFGGKDILAIHKLKSISNINELHIDSENEIFDNLCYDTSINNITGLAFKKGLFSPNGTDGMAENKFAIEMPFSYVCVLNLKLNSAFLLSSGLIFISSVAETIENKIRNFLQHNHYEIVFSFSSYELIVILNDNNENKINQIVQEIRKLLFKDLNFDFAYKTFIANQLTPPSKEDFQYSSNTSFFEMIDNFSNSTSNSHKIPNTHIFSDTQSFFGVKLCFDAMVLNNHKVKLHDTNLMEFEGTWREVFTFHQDFFSVDNDKAKLHIDFKVKPSFYSNFIYLLNKIIGKDDKRNASFVAGKLDYTFNVKFRPKDYVKIYFAWLTREKTNIEGYNVDQIETLGDIVRSIQSKIYLDPISDSIREIVCYPTNELDNLNFNSKTTLAIKAKLRKIGIQEQVSNKFIKMFHTFNHGFTSSLTFNLHLDTYLYLRSVVDELDHILDNNNKTLIPIQAMVEHQIEIYEKSYQIRALQHLSHDSSLDLFINYNSNMQGFVSDLDSILKGITSATGYTLDHIYSGELYPSALAIINFVKPESSKNYTNYSLNDIYNPGIFINYTFQEALVILYKNMPRFAFSVEACFGSLENELRDSLHKSKNSAFILPYEKVIVKEESFEYFYRDQIKFLLFYKDFDLFYYWHCSTIMQNSTLYQIGGTMNQIQCCSEIFRLLFIFTINYEKENLEFEELKLKFIEYNPFDSAKEELNNAIWRRYSIEICDALLTFFIQKRSYFRNEISKVFNDGRYDDFVFKTKISDYTIENLEKEFKEYLTNYSASLIRKIKLNLLQIFLSKVCITYLRDSYNEYNKDQKIINLYSNDTVEYSSNTLNIKKTGGLNFKNSQDQLKLNKKNNQYLILFAHVAYQYKMLSYDFYLEYAKKNEIA